MNKDLIIQKQSELIAELKRQLNVKWFTPGSRLRKLEQEIASLEAQDKELSDQDIIKSSMEYNE